MANVRFYCDESYDSQSNKPNVFVVAGYAASEEVSAKIERSWRWKNTLVGVPRFHASHLNARQHEYEGWTKQRAKRYSSDLLDILVKQKRKLHVVSTGVLANEYEKIINAAGRQALGSPYILCFKQCVLSLAEELHRPENNWESDTKISVVIERNDWQSEAIKVFEMLKHHPTWRAAYRLGSCIPGDRDEFVLLQAADLIAYESFKLIHEQHFGQKRNRPPMQKLFPPGKLSHNGFSGFYYSQEYLERVKPHAEGHPWPANGCIYIPWQEWEAIKNN